MRKSSGLLLAAVCWVCVGSFSCAPREKIQGRAREIVLSHEIGPVFLQEDKTNLEHVFMVDNPSNSQTMRLEMVRQSCACTRSTIDNPIVAPGSVAHIRLQASVPYQTNVMKVLAQFSTGLPDMPDLVLRLSIRTYVGIETDPGRFPTYAIRPGTQESIPFDVFVCYSADKDPRLPIQFDCGSDRLTVTVRDQSKEVEHGVCIVTARCQARIRCPSIADGALPTEHCQRARWKKRSLFGTAILRPRAQFVGIHAGRLWSRRRVSSYRPRPRSFENGESVLTQQKHSQFCADPLTSRQSKWTLTLANPRPATK